MTYIIGEIGQNHNGSVDLAKLIIELASKPVVDKFSGESLGRIDAVKLTKRDLGQELSASQMAAPYASPHSFGATYGEHRVKLELNAEQHFELYSFAKSFGLDFVETLCATGAMDILKFFSPDYLKVASRDLTNLPLLAALAETKIPMILSTGMGGKAELDNALKVITAYHGDVSILHCVSQYPTEYRNVNLNTIDYLLENYPQYVIGYSDHTIGVSVPVAAVAKGARIIEKHITLDRRMKGTDQACSLGIDGLERLVRDIRNMELALGVKDFFVCSEVESSRIKLERSIAAIRDIAAGEILTERDIHLLSPGSGTKWCDRGELIGRHALVNIHKNEIIQRSELSP